MSRLGLVAVGCSSMEGPRSTSLITGTNSWSSLPPHQKGPKYQRRWFMVLWCFLRLSTVTPGLCSLFGCSDPLASVMPHTRWVGCRIPGLQLNLAKGSETEAPGGTIPKPFGEWGVEVLKQLNPTYKQNSQLFQPSGSSNLRALTGSLTSGSLSPV